MDWLPVVSTTEIRRAKRHSETPEGARKTQMNFVRQCPVISQSYALGVYLAGDEKEAQRSQTEFLSTMSGVVDSLPVVGHAKGVVHYAVGDKEGGDRSMKAASRTTVQIGAGVGGFMVGGPVGAAGAAISAGYAMDGITTGIDSAVHHEYRPSGILSAVDQVVRDPKDPGKWFDVVAPVAIEAAFAVKTEPRWKLEQMEDLQSEAEYAVEQEDEMDEMLASSGKIPSNTEHNIIKSSAVETETGLNTTGNNIHPRTCSNEPLTSESS